MGEWNGFGVEVQFVGGRRKLVGEGEGVDGGDDSALV